MGNNIPYNMNDITDKSQCAMCNGEGKIRKPHMISSEDTNATFDAEVFIEYRCPLCNGEIKK